MNYDEVVNYISRQHRFGKVCGRDVTFEMMQHMNHPESGMKVIHIAGSNGKGSVAAFLTSLLRAGTKADGSALKIGAFTSPHIIDFTERITVNGHQIPKEDVARIGTYFINSPQRLSPTMFDYCLGIAIRYFTEQQCDYVVLETGLGGGKDSTRGLMCTPLVSVITSISLEHTEILGDTLAEIAAEKAGILREGTRCVTGPLLNEAMEVIADKCRELNIPLKPVAAPVDDDIELGLLGMHQRFNAAVAVEVLRELIDVTKDSAFDGLLEKADEENYKLTDRARQALRLTRHAGRMEVISSEPFVLVDGAHNMEGIIALTDSLFRMYKGELFTFVMCVMRDKDYDDMLRELAPFSRNFIATSIDYDRALEAERLCEEAKKVGIHAVYEENYEKALERARKMVSQNGDTNNKIVCTGSLYFIGEVIKYFQE